MELFDYLMPEQEYLTPGDPSAERIGPGKMSHPQRFDSNYPRTHKALNQSCQFTAKDIAESGLESREQKTIGGER